MKKRRRKISKTLTGFLAILWVLSVGYGMAKLMTYSTTPGLLGSLDQNWPKNTSLNLSDQTFTLVVALHPSCPCSVATIAELNKIVAWTSHRMSVKILAVRTGKLLTQRERKEPAFDDARIIPGVEIIENNANEESLRFGFKTSGHTALYDSKGKLLFNGGITRSRGHQGDNAGATAILDFVLRGSSKTTQTKVYGCHLYHPV